MPQNARHWSEWKGLRTLNIASLNPDSMRGEGTQQEIVKGVIKNKIHLAEIQETHITSYCNYMVANYRVITEAEDKNKETGIVNGGTSIMVRESIRQKITHLARRRSRVLRVTLDRTKSKMPIRIISTYAPRNGHTAEAERKHGGDVKELLSTTCERHLLIWGAGASAQLGNRNHEEEKYAKKRTCRPIDNMALHESHQGEKEMDQDFA